MTAEKACVAPYGVQWFSTGCTTTTGPLVSRSHPGSRQWWLTVSLVVVYVASSASLVVLTLPHQLSYMLQR